MGNDTNAATAIDGIYIERTFDAPAEKVWKAWTEPALVMRWWGPANFSSPAAKIDFRVGGTYHFCMQAPDGKDYWTTGTYRDIEPMRRIVFTDSFADAGGNIVPASAYGMGGEWPEALVVALTFAETGGQTRFTITHTGVPESTREMCMQGWNESFDKLAQVAAN